MELNTKREAALKRKQELDAIRAHSGVLPARVAFAKMGLSDYLGYRAIRDGSLRALKRGRTYDITQAEVERQLSLA